MRYTIYDRRLMDWQNDVGVGLLTEKQLNDFIRQHQVLDPHFVELVKKGGGRLLIGIGRGLACVQFTGSNDGPPYLMAMVTGQTGSDVGAEFLMGDTPTPVPKQFIIPPTVMENIVLHFYRTGCRLESVKWEEI